MGTRSLVEFIEGESNVLATIYQQYDGYPSGVGIELAEFLASGQLTNGLPVGAPDSQRLFNGAGCLAAQFIAQFKTAAGGLYMCPAGCRDHGEEYIYQVHVPWPGEGDYLIRVRDVWDERTHDFTGVEDFAAYCRGES